MAPEMYRKQLIQFIKMLYPDGIPEGVNCVSFSDSFKKVKMKFYFDRNDIVVEDNVVIDTRKFRQQDEDKFQNSLTEEDISWLKSMEMAFPVQVV